jgi:hypothetical protein
VRPAMDAEALTTIAKHLGHKWHLVKTAVAIQSLQDLGLTADFDKITCAEG